MSITRELGVHIDEHVVRAIAVERIVVAARGTERST